MAVVASPRLSALTDIWRKKVVLENHLNPNKKLYFLGVCSWIPDSWRIIWNVLLRVLLCSYGSPKMCHAQHLSAALTVSRLLNAPGTNSVAVIEHCARSHLRRQHDK